MVKPKRKKILYEIISIVSLIGFIVCTVILIYPVISDRWNRYRDKQLISEYNEAVTKGDKKEHEEELKEAREYNQFLYLQGRDIVTDAEYEPDAYYETLLNVTNNGIMCYIEIPKIDL